MIVNLRHWTYSDTIQNFGDALSPYIVSRLLGPQHTLVCNESGDVTLFGIGSWLHYCTDGAHVWGTGVRTNPPEELDATHNYRHLHVHAMRGPLTRDFLLQRGIACPEVYGDPALLLPRYFNKRPLKHLKGKVGIVPHCSQVGQHVSDERYEVINPLGDVEVIAHKILSCRAIISASLHGLVVADAYGIPNVWLRTELSEGTLKFMDYFASQGRTPSCINSVKEFDERDLYRGGNHVNLDLLAAAFPFSAEA
jgi:pyruvyltransferase